MIITSDFRRIAERSRKPMQTLSTIATNDTKIRFTALRRFAKVIVRLYYNAAKISTRATKVSAY